VPGLLLPGLKQQRSLLSLLALVITFNVLVPTALQILRQKRMYETQRETLYNQQFNMEQTRFTVESVQVGHSVSLLFGLHKASQP